jgi:hypothetical protein
MITWFGWTWHLGHGLLMEHCSFEFGILVGFESWWCDWGLHKEGKFNEDERFLEIVFGKRFLKTILGKWEDL